ncbi:MAG TPA: inositol monophosphatase family protein [Actinomycetota bacterium]|nr:inositol monophosphatase family protein [Actinomycetota bacterium]
MFEAELRFAHEVADRAAQIALPPFQDGVEAHLKEDRTPVTEADLRIEALVREAVAERFPEDAVLGEEGGLLQNGSSDRTWIVDPIDGTRNFAAGIQVWATLLALRVEDELVLGVVSAPALGERYDAVRGEGSRLNGEPIRVSGTSSPGEAALCFGDPEAFDGHVSKEALLGLTGEVLRSRGFGDFWGHLLVARGSMDVMIEPSLAEWDYAALVPIVEEAGGRITQTDGSPVAHGRSALTTNGVLHEAITARFAR